MPGSRVIVANIIKLVQETLPLWNTLPPLSREPLEVDQICQWLECAPHWEEQSINWVFHSSMPGSRVIVANIIKLVQETLPLWNTLPPLSREPLEVDQICQWLECAPHWEEQSINWVFHSSIPGSRVIVANIIKLEQETLPLWNTLPPLSREPLEVDQICQWLECAPHWEEQSINWVFHSSMPGSRVIVANIIKLVQETLPLWNTLPPLSREPLEVDQICQWLECAPHWEEQSVNRLLYSSMPGSRVIVANIIKHGLET